MCGIVGYVGPRPALDVVVEGLRRLEYRGYDSAGVAIIPAGGGARRWRRRPAGSRTSTRNWPPARSPGTTGMGHTRWATHGAPERPQRPPARRWRRPGRRRAQRDHRELRRSCGPSASRPASSSRARPTPRSWPTSSRPRLAERRPTLTDAVRAVCRRLQGAFTLVLVDAEQPDVVVAARRNSPLVLGVGDGEMFLGSDVAAFIEFTRDAVELGPEPGRRDQPRRVHDHRLRRCARRRARPSTSTGTSPPPRRAATTSSCSRRSTSSRRRCATRCPATSSAARSCSTSSAWTSRSCATSTRCSSSPAAPPTTPG